MVGEWCIFFIQEKPLNCLIFALSLFSMSTSGYFAAEPSAYGLNNADTVFYNYSDYYWIVDSAYVITELSGVIRSGIGCQMEGFSSDLSFGIPFYSFGTKDLPFLGLRMGYERNGVMLFLGYTFPIIGKEQNSFGFWTARTEQILPARTFYSGLWKRKSKANVFYDIVLSLRKEYVSYVEYKYNFRHHLHGKTINTSYFHTVATLRVGHRGDRINQYLWINMNQRHIGRSFSCSIGLGIGFGKCSEIPFHYEIVTVRSFHFYR